MTSMRRAFLAGTTIAAILLSPVMPGGSPRHVEPPTGQPVQTAAFRWPLDPPVAIVRGFAPPPEPWLPGHRGVDLAARPGQTVRAAGSGVVTFAGPIAGRGVLVIRLTATPTGPAADGPADTAGLRITYEPVHPRVQRGDRVRTGQVVGQMEGSHHCGVLGSCLHWGLRRGMHTWIPCSWCGHRGSACSPLTAILRPVRGRAGRLGRPPRWRPKSADAQDLR